VKARAFFVFAGATAASAARSPSPLSPSSSSCRDRRRQTLAPTHNTHTRPREEDPTPPSRGPPFPLSRTSQTPTHNTHPQAAFREAPSTIAPPPQRRALSSCSFVTARGLFLGAPVTQQLVAPCLAALVSRNGRRAATDRSRRRERGTNDHTAIVAPLFSPSGQPSLAGPAVQHTRTITGARAGATFSTARPLLLGGNICRGGAAAGARLIPPSRPRFESIPPSHPSSLPLKIPTTGGGFGQQQQNAPSPFGQPAATTPAPFGGGFGQQVRGGMETFFFSPMWGRATSCSSLSAPLLSLPSRRWQSIGPSSKKE
jgi:hypothetical protein